MFKTFKIKNSIKILNSKFIILLIFFGLFGLAKGSQAATWYVDSVAAGSHNGTSWANAWTSLDAISGIAAGDTVYISGGPTGTSQTYDLNTNRWAAAGGSFGNPITYKIGQDPSHNGTAIFNKNYTGGYNWFVTLPDYFVLSGDAGDGAQHFRVVGFGSVAYTNVGNGIRISYVYADNLAEAVRVTTGNNLEIDHCWLRINYPNSNDAIVSNIVGTTWDNSLFHDNAISLVHDPSHSNYGPDAFEMWGTGFSIYNNTITGFQGTYVSSQHADGLQTSSTVVYVKVYNNKIMDMTNYGVYIEAPTNPVIINHLRIFNNIIGLTDATIGAGNPGGIVISSKQPGTVSDVIIANNTVADMTGTGASKRGIVAANDGGDAIAAAYVQNNAIVNCDTPLQIASGYAADHNSVLTTTDAPNSFIAYMQYGGLSNNYHLLPSASSLIDQGVSFASYFTTDKDTVTRPQGSAWDIGAYEYASGSSDTTPPAAPSGLAVN